MNEQLPLEIIHPKAAGIDVGSKSHFVAIGQGEDQVREFGVNTQDHNHLISWLVESKISTIAMESTGNYWHTLFTALQVAGFEVLLVNGRDVKNLKGKKSDVMDCQWIQKLNSLGLLSASFLPDEFSRKLKSYFLHRQHLIKQCAKYTKKMLNALRLMNIRLDIAISDINGKTGRVIIKAIIEGERDPKVLAAFADVRVKKSQEEIALALEGEWREDLIFLLAEGLSIYQNFRERLQACDAQIKSLLERHISLNPKNLPPMGKVKKRKPNKNSLSFDLRPYAYHILEVDLYQIEYISHTSVLSILSIVGKGIEKFPSSKRFVSWLRLAPNNKISGGRVISSRIPKGKNPLSVTLRQAANTIGNSRSYPLKPFFARIAYRKGRGAAITATARKLAVIIFNMMTYKEPFMPELIESHRIERSRKLKQVRKSIRQLGLTRTDWDSLCT